jgi:hypothetical protein
MLKMLKNDGYNVSCFDSNTNIREPAKQTWAWDDLESTEFIGNLEEIFGFSEGYITEDEYLQLKLLVSLPTL